MWPRKSKGDVWKAHEKVLSHVIHILTPRICDSSYCCSCSYSVTEKPGKHTIHRLTHYPKVNTQSKGLHTIHRQLLTAFLRVSHGRSGQRARGQSQEARRIYNPNTINTPKCPQDVPKIVIILSQHCHYIVINQHQSTSSTSNISQWQYCQSKRKSMYSPVLWPHANLLTCCAKNIKLCDQEQYLLDIWVMNAICENLKRKIRLLAA